MPFVKGDPRINRKGRPKSFDKWRDLLIDISNEPAVQRDKQNNVKRLVLIQIPAMVDGKPVFDETGAPVMINHYATNAEMIARQWLSDPKNQEKFIQGAFGKVPDAVDIVSDNKTEIIVTYAKPDSNSTETP